jgi:hypothetical protein
MRFLRLVASENLQQTFRNRGAALHRAAAGAVDEYRAPKRSISVMPGLVPGIHVFLVESRKTWMAGINPAMTTSKSPCALRVCPTDAVDSLLEHSAARIAEPGLVPPQACGDSRDARNFAGAETIDIRRAGPALGRRAAHLTGLRVRRSHREQDTAPYDEADYDNRHHDADQDCYLGHGADLWCRRFLR